MPPNSPALSLHHPVTRTALRHGAKQRINDYALAIVLALGGIIFLAMLHIAPSQSDRFAILIYPPWLSAQTVRTDIAALNLPLLDFRWNGRLIAVALPDPTDLTRNQPSGWYYGKAIRIAGDIWPGCAPIGD